MCIMRKVFDTLAGMSRTADDNGNDVINIINALPPDEKRAYDEECDIAIPLFDAGARGEELYRLIDEELERRSLAGANV